MMIHRKKKYVTVNTDEEYRIMAYDLSDGKYYFIDRWIKDQRHFATCLGSKTNVRRYVLYRGYVFKVDQEEYPEFDTFADATEWVRRTASESRLLPDCWQWYCPKAFFNKTSAVMQMVEWERNEQDAYLDEVEARCMAQTQRWVRDYDDLDYCI